MKSIFLQNIIKQTVFIGIIFHINVFAVLSGFITEDTTFTIENSPYSTNGDVWLIKLESELNNGCVTYYPFNGNANDESGNGNHGTVNGATLTTDRFGNQNSAYSFDGVDDYIEVNHEERLDIQKFTVATWVRYNLGSMNKAGVFNNGYTVDHYALCADSSGITIWTNWPASNNVGVMYLSHVLTDENFHFLTATYDGQNRVIWIDGEKVLERNFSEVIDYSTSEKCYVGVNFPGSDEFFKGDIDDIRIYNRVLSNSEIDSLYHDGKWASQTIILVPAQYTTIQSAIDAATDGDTVLVYPGTYVENINFNGKNIVVGSLTLTTGDTSYISQTVIDGNQNGSVVTIESGEDSTAELSGFLITNGSGNVLQVAFGGGIYIENSDPTLKNLIITKNNIGNSHGGGIWCDNSNPILKNILITENSCNGSGGGIYFYSSSPSLTNITIRGNTVVDMGGGIECGGGSNPTLKDVTISKNSAYWGGGISCRNNSNPFLKNVIISGNTGQGGGVYCEGCSPILTNVTIYGNSNGIQCELEESNPIIINSIIYGNDYQITLPPGSGEPTITYSNIQSGSTGHSWFGAGCINANPLFVDPSGGNYNISNYSPCIGAGIDSIQINGTWHYAPTTDIEGNPCPNPAGSKPDMGAYENPRATPLDTISPIIQILNPVEGFSIPEYEPLTVTWTATDNIAMDSVLVIYTNEPGVDLQFMGKVPADSSQFTFDVPKGITNQAMIYLHGWDTSGNDTLVHSPYFSVTDNTPPDSVVITDLDTCAIGDGVTIEWISGDNSGSFRMHYISLSINEKPFILIDSVAGTIFSNNWMVPNIVSDSCRIKVESFDPVGLSAADTSDYFSIVDNIRPEVEVLTPQEGFSIPEHEDITVTWVATDNIQLDCIIVSYSKDGGYSGRTMGIVSPDTNYFTFQIPSGVTDSATIRVKAKDIYFNTGAEFSPLFSVTDNTPPKVDLLSIFSDSSFEIMSTRSISWAASDNVAIQAIDLAYSIDAGDTWISISENESNDGEYSWLIPDTPSDQCKIKVTATDSVGLSDEAVSAGLFTIYVTYPKLISHSTIIAPLDTIQLGFSQALNTGQFNTGLSLSNAIVENLTYDLQFLNNNQDVYIYPENSFISGDTISLILSADQITNAYGYGLDGNQNDTFEGSPVDDDTITVYVNYSGDFDGNDQVDFNDLALFANGWYSKDYKYELGPVTGDIPHFITMADSLFNIEDAMTFGRMWNWFVGIGKHVITMPQLSFGGGFTTEQNGNDLIIHSRSSAGKRIVLQYDPEIITINKKQQSLSKPTDLTFEFYADCIDSNRSEYVHYTFNEELSIISVIFTIESKQRNPVNIIIGIEGINKAGELILSDVITTRFQPIPDKFEVFPNYPNPFNSQTVIEYAIPVQSDVLINIYDLLGRKVKTLTNNRHEAKYYTLIWDGKDEQGRLAASGLYFLRIVARTESKTFIKTKKMVMIR